jgi:hypothetical protein
VLGLIPNMREMVWENIALPAGKKLNDKEDFDACHYDQSWASK